MLMIHLVLCPSGHRLLLSINSDMHYCSIDSWTVLGTHIIPMKTVPVMLKLLLYWPQQTINILAFLLSLLALGIPY
jgi:hypothetical protein